MIFSYTITVDFHGAVKRTQFQVAFSAFEWIQGHSAGRPDSITLVNYIGAMVSSFPSPIGKQIFESELEKIVPAVAFDEIVLVGIVAAGAFIGKIRIAD